MSAPTPEEIASINEHAAELNREAEDVLEYQGNLFDAEVDQV